MMVSTSEVKSKDDHHGDVPVRDERCLRAKVVADLTLVNVAGQAVYHAY